MKNIDITLQSLQSLMIELRFGEQTLATGTGFTVVHKDIPYLITNRHNVTGRNQETGQPLSRTGGIPDNIVIIHNRKNRVGEWLGCIEPLYTDNKARWYEHPTLGSQADFVALPLSNLEDVELYPYNPSNPGRNIAIGPAETVSVIGFPFGLTAGGSLGIWATGFIASEPMIDFHELPILLIDCRSRQGQSGSPVIAYRSGGLVNLDNGSSATFNGPVSKFIGIYSGRINPESDLGIVWKAYAISELIESL